MEDYILIQNPDTHSDLLKDYSLFSWCLWYRWFHAALDWRLCSDVGYGFHHLLTSQFVMTQYQLQIYYGTSSGIWRNECDYWENATVMYINSYATIYCIIVL